jgi:hypothetical protein
MSEPAEEKQEGTAQRAPGLAGSPAALVSLILGLPVVGMVLFGAGFLMGHRWLVRQYPEPQRASLVNQSISPGPANGGKEIAAGMMPAPPSSPPSPVPSTARHFASEVEGWKVIKGSSEPQDFADFLAAYPASRFAVAAGIRLRQLRRRQASPSPAGVSNESSPPRHSKDRHGVRSLTCARRPTQDTIDKGSHLEESYGAHRHQGDC